MIALVYDSYAYANSVSLPALQNSTSAVTIKTTDRNFNYSAFDTHGAQKVITGTYSCQGSHTNPSATTSSTSTTFTAKLVSAENSSGGLSAGAKAGIGVGVSLGIIGFVVVGALVFLRRHKHKLKPEGKECSIEKDGKPVAELGGRGIAREELGTGNEAQELPAQRGVSEAGMRSPVVHKIDGTHEMEGQKGESLYEKS